MEDLESFGAYLKRLRESKELTLRQAAQAAELSSGYLSQIEGGKRGKRKRGAHFAPHPLILKKLAQVYHVPAQQLFERAGFFEQERSYRGFSEEREIDRCFDFVIHDPVFKRALTTADKRAIVNCYETLTGKKLITWAGDDSPMAKKSDFRRLRLEDGVLYSDSVQNTLTLEEVARELETDVGAVKQLIQDNHLSPRYPVEDPPVIEKAEVRALKDNAMREGLKLLSVRDRKHRPRTDQEYLQVGEEIQSKELENLKEKLRGRGRPQNLARKRQRTRK